MRFHMICPLHGFVHRTDIGRYVEKYSLWSSYTPEEQGVMIAYASVYGNTENVAEILACRLREKGMKTAMFDVSVITASDIVAEAFRYSHFVFALNNLQYVVYSFRWRSSCAISPRIIYRTEPSRLSKNGSWGAGERQADAGDIRFAKKY